MLLALHPTDWSTPRAAVLAALAALAAAGAHRHAAALVLGTMGLVLVARPFVRPVQYFHLGSWHDLDLTSHTHYGMLTRGGLLLALAVVVASVLMRDGSEIRRRLHWPVVAIVMWALYPLLGEGRSAYQSGIGRTLGDAWIAGWTAVAATATVVVLAAAIVDEVRARRRERELARASASLFGLP